MDGKSIRMSKAPTSKNQKPKLMGGKRTRNVLVPCAKRQKRRKGDDSVPETICTDNVPECVWLEILCRLPPRSMVRCKRVSKPWLSLISHPSFAAHYRSLHPPRWQFLWKTVGLTDNSPGEINDSPWITSHWGSPLYSKITFPLSALQQTGWPLTSRPNLGVKDASNGLLLLYLLGYPPNYLILNPLTTQYIVLPPPPPTPARFSGTFEQEEGFVTALDRTGTVISYRVVRMLLTRAAQRITFQVYSSERGHWQEFTSPCRFPHTCEFAKPVLHKGVLHWSFNLDLVIAYDPYATPYTYRRITFSPLPSHSTTFPEDDDDETLQPAFKLGVFHGHLGCVVKASPEISDPHWKLWIFGDCNKDVWSIDNSRSLDFNINNYACHDAAYSHGSWTITKLVSFHPLDSDVIYFLGKLEDKRCVLSYNIQTQNLEPIEQSYSYMNLPFVMPVWPSAIPEP